MTLALLLSFSLSLPAFAKPEEISRRIQRGIDDIYLMDFDDCEKTFRALLQEYPGIPYGYFGLATASWARFEYQQEGSDIKTHDEFEKLIAEAIPQGHRWIKDHPTDAEGYLCLGGMYGMRSRLALTMHRWVRAYWDGTKALSLIKKAEKLDPKLYDVNMGLGMWDYYTDTLPGVIKVLGKLVAIRGDTFRGMARLKIAAEKGEHTATAAKLILVEAYADRNAKVYNPKEGLRLIREIRQKFPKNSLFHFVEMIYLYENRLAQEALQSAQAYLKAIRERKPFYDARYEPRGYVGLGTAYFLTRDWPKAAEAFARGAEALQPKVPNRWALFSLIRLAQVKDVMGDRAGALSIYKQALKAKDLWEFADFVKPFLKKAAIESDLLGTALSPP